MKTTDFVILYEEIERGCLAFQLLYIPSGKSKYIHELDAHKLKDTYGIPFYDMFRWIQKQQKHNVAVLENL